MKVDDPGTRSWRLRPTAEADTGALLARGITEPPVGRDRRLLVMPATRGAFRTGHINPAQVRVLWRLAGHSCAAMASPTVRPGSITPPRSASMTGR